MMDGWIDGWRLVCGIPEGCSLQPVCAPASFKAVCFTNLNRYFHVCVNLAFQPRNSLSTANVDPPPIRVQASLTRLQRYLRS